MKKMSYWNVCTLCITVSLIFISDRMTMGADRFADPIPLQADGKLIDLGFHGSHSGPALEDLDHDGDLDLIVGTHCLNGYDTMLHGGRFHFYENVGSRTQPSYASRGWLQAGGVDAEVPIGCCIAASPAFVDLNGDGLRDMISGCFRPGGTYFFPRKSGAGIEFSARQELVDEEGRSLLRHPDSTNESDSAGSWPAAVDWDLDGDQDLIIGSFDGTIVLRRNVGDAKTPVFSRRPEVLKASGSEIKIPGGGHAAITIADWDADGQWDILSGSNDGSVWWVRNIGKPGAPAFGASERLIDSTASSNGLAYVLKDGPQPGTRSQICVADYNQDGQLDLLVGDYQMTYDIERELSNEERTLVIQNTNEKEHIDRQIQQRSAEIKAAVLTKYPGDLVRSEAAHEEARRLYGEWVESPESQQKMVRLEELKAELIPLLPEKMVYNGLASTSGHSFVWLYLRFPSEKTASQPVSKIPEPMSDPTISEPVVWGGQVKCDDLVEKNQVLVEVTAKILAGYHIGIAQPHSPNAVPTRILVEMPEGWKLLSETLPVSKKSFTNNGLEDVYEGVVTFTKTYRYSGHLPKNGLAKVTIKYMACNETQCLKPEVKEFEMKVPQ